VLAEFRYKGKPGGKWRSYVKGYTIVNLSYNALLTPIPSTPNYFKEVKSIGLRHLKAILCKDACMNIDGVGREGLEVLLCIELSIMTSGVDAGDDFGHKIIPRCAHYLLNNQLLDEYKSLTPHIY
jgi:hypothetical protein